MGLHRKGSVAEGGIVSDITHAVIGRPLDIHRDGIYAPLGNQFINGFQVGCRKTQQPSPPVLPLYDSAANLVVPA